MTESHKHRVVFFPVPKCAGTSIKSWMYKIVCGKPFDKDDYETVKTIHYFSSPKNNGGNWEPAYRDYFSFIVVRDPIQRFVSAYTNKVANQGRLKMPKFQESLAAAGLSNEPTIEELAMNIEAYCQAAPLMDHHLCPQKLFVKKVYNKVTKCYNFTSISQLEEDLREHIDSNVNLPKLQVSNANNVDLTLSNAAVDKLKEFYQVDYDMIAELRAAGKFVE